MIEDELVYGPLLISNDPESGSFRKHIEYPERFIRLSEKGRHLADVLELTYEVREELLQDSLPDLIECRYLDLVRRMCVRLENHLRDAVGSKSFGQRLVDECFGDEGGLLPLKKCSLTVGLEIRAIFRRFFNYVRNDVTHNEPMFDLTTTCRLLRRCSLLMNLVDMLRQAKVQDKGDAG
jgi:hypothetical protein